MTCGLIDISCHIQAVLDPWLFYIKMGFFCVVAIAVLVFLAWIYRNFGWWGVAVAISAGAAAAIFKKGVDFGRRTAPPTIEKVKPPRVRNPRTKSGNPPVNSGTWWNWEKGRWEGPGYHGDQS